MRLKPGSLAAELQNPRQFRKAQKCGLMVAIGKTQVQGICDTGASGGNCLDASVFACLPSGSYRVITRTPSVCVGINKMPVKIQGKIMLDFSFENEQQQRMSFREEFNLIENLINPVVIGLPFLQKHKAILSFERKMFFIRDMGFPLGQIDNMSDLPPPHLALFETITIPPLSSTFTNTFLAGNQGLIDHEKAKSLYVRPFHNECSKDVPHMAPHAIVDPKRKLIPLELINVWPYPITITSTTPVALVDTVNPEFSKDGDVEAVPTVSSTSLDEGPVYLAEELANQSLFGSADRSSLGECVSGVVESPLTQGFSGPIVDPTDRPPNASTRWKPMDDGLWVRFATIPLRPSMEEIFETPADEASPMNNFAPGEAGIRILEEIFDGDDADEPVPDLVYGEGDEDDEDEFVPELIDEDDDDEEVVNSDPNVLKINKKGCVFTGDNRKKFNLLCEKYENVFSKNEQDLGSTTLLYHGIDLTTQRPIYAPNYRAPPPDVQRAVDRETEKLLASGCLRESNSPYSAPIVLTRKKSGGWRYCGDFRRLNKVTVKQSFPLPNIHDGVRRLKNPKVFSSLDLTKGYHQISILESHRKYFAFSDGKRHLEYVKVPMGARNSSASMQALMELVMRGLPVEYLLVYLDDILIATPDEETHLEMLEKVFDALSRAKLKLNPAKCVFANSSVDGLGFTLDANGIKPDSRNLSKIREWPKPKDVTGVRAYLGLCNYYRAHIPFFAKLAEPLTNLLKKGVEFVWTAECDKSFDDLKRELLEGSATSFPDFDKEFYVKPDASKTTVGALLTQKDERGKEVMIAAASQRLNAAESAWAPYDREMYGIVWAVRSFSHYLRFRPFVIYTDHKPLLTCVNIDPKKDATGKRTRWALEWSTYEFSIKHKSGKRHGDADALSRAEHADAPATDPRDDEDLVVLGALVPAEVPVAELMTNEVLQDRLREAQKDDDELRVVVEALKRGGNVKKTLSEARVPRWFVRRHRSLLLRDGLVYNTTMDGDERVGQLLIPKTMVDEILIRAHGDYRSGHPGARRMRGRLERFCIWPTMVRDVDEKVATCHECQAYRPRSNKEVPIIPQKALYPMHYVMTDLLALKPASEGFDHVLVVEDRFTRYCSLYPMKGAEAATMAKRFEQFVTRFGFPVIWGSDSGPEFRNKLVSALEKVYETKHEYSLAYHPQKQGSVERKNRTLIQELAKKCLQFGNKWSKHLPWIEFSLNSVPHKALGRSPYSFMFGRDPRVPTQNMLPVPTVNTTGWKPNMKTFWRDTQTKIANMHKMRAEHLAKYQESFNKNQNPKPPFKPGDWVLKRLPRENRQKLSLHWDGPFVVKKHLTPPNLEPGKGNVYVIVDGEGNEFVRSIADLKMYNRSKDEAFFPQRRSDSDDSDGSEAPWTTRMTTRSMDVGRTTTDDQFEFQELYGDDDDDDGWDDQVVASAPRLPSLVTPSRISSLFGQNMGGRGAGGDEGVAGHDSRPRRRSSTQSESESEGDSDDDDYFDARGIRTVPKSNRIISSHSRKTVKL